ncbi:Tfiiic transcription initiation factor complex subunit [Teratosphaeria destructans]|uniref:Tfiiic transcription initiation factor complex subunit n=1 Tax=Teratosphaeria destructans TaxID=418781 RepID=A0A9W7W1R4_9PEZI|nr:Tfiiic transcription initiation factor complex subunit [Teratosphaeria destructans]
MDEIPEQLIERLVDEVALTGTFGLGEDAFNEKVASFYHERNQEWQNQQDVATSSGHPLEDHDESLVTVDDALLAKVRDRLEQRREIHVKKEGDGILLADAKGEDPTTTSRHAGRILIATHARMRQVLSHHRSKRVEQMGALVFDCLSVIAAYGPAGILQNDLRRVTGQQKQSVPLRTDRLAKRGYITKRVVLAHGAKTSLLQLKRWAAPNNVIQPDQAQATNSNHPSAQTIIDYDVWFDETIRLLQAQPHHLIAIQDLRIGLGISKKKYETRALMRCIQRMSHEGIFRKVSARPADEEGRVSGKAMRCIQLLQSPTDADRVLWRSRMVKGKTHKKSSVVDQSATEEEGATSDDDEGSEKDLDTAVPLRPGDEETEHQEVGETGQIENDMSDDLDNSNVVELGNHQSPIGKRKRTAPHRFDPEAEHNAITPSVEIEVPIGKRKRVPTRRFDYGLSVLGSEDQDLVNGIDNEYLDAPFIDELREAASQPRKKRKYTKRQHDGSKLPTGRTKRRITSEKSNPKFEAWAKQTAERLIKDQVAAEKEAAKLETEQQGEHHQESQLPEDGNGDTYDADEEGAESLRQRIAQLEGELLARSRSGVYINPPGALDMKASKVCQRGRPRNACIAVIKSDRLSELNLANATQDGAQAAPSQTRPAEGPALLSVPEDDHHSNESGAELSKDCHAPAQVKALSMGASRELARGTPAPIQLPKERTAQEDSQQARQTNGAFSAAQQPANSIQPDPTSGSSEYFTKEYVNQHADEVFNHCGFGRYKRGLRPSKKVPDTDGTQISSFSSGSSKRSAIPAAVNGDPDNESEVDARPAPQASPSPSVVNDEHTYKRAYVDAHPGEQFHHVGGGRWRRGPKAHRFGRRQSTSGKRVEDTALVRPSSLVMSTPSLAPHELLLQRTQASPNPYIPDVLEDQILDAAVPAVSLPPRASSEQAKAPPATGVQTSAPCVTSLSRSDLVHSSPVAALAELRKKRGSPKQAIIAEKKRLQTEIDGQRLEKEIVSLPESTPSLIAKLSIPALKETGMDELLRRASIKRSSEGLLTYKPIMDVSLPSESRADGLVRPSITSTPNLAVQDFRPSAAVQTCTPSVMAPLTIVRPYKTPEKTNKALRATAEVTAPSCADVDGNSSADESDEDAMDIDIPGPLYDDGAADGDSDFKPDAEAPEVEEPDDSGMETDVSEPRDNRDFVYPRSNRVKYGSMERQRFSNEDKKRRQRASIIVDLLEQCGGVFPGNGEIFFPFCREWYKMYDVTPDRRTLNAAVQRLIGEGKLKRVPFSFRDDEGDTQERSVLAFSSIDSSSVLIDEVKEAMIRAYPSRYLPEAIGGQQAEDEGRRIESGRTGATQHGTSKDEFPVMEALTVQRTQQAIIMADAAAQAKGSADARSRRLEQSKAGAKRQYARRKQNSGLFSVGTGAEIANTNTSVVTDARTMTNARIYGPMHTRTQVEGRMLSARSTSTLDGSHAPSRLLMSTSQYFYPTSGVFSTDTPVFMPAWGTTQSAPKSLEEILQRVELMGYPKDFDPTLGMDEFSLTVDRIYAWESELRSRKIVTDDAEWHFINLTLAENQVTAARRPGAGIITLDKLVEYDSPEEFVTKDYVMTHPAEEFHHVGAGRYRRGPRPADYVRGKKPSTTTKKQKRSFISTGIECYTKVQVDARPDEEFHRIPGGLYRRGPPPAVGTLKPALLSKEEYFSKEYKDAHPDEEFYHIGGGRYRRGRMPQGYRDPRKNGVSERYERERSKNHGWTYHKTARPSQRKDSNERPDQTHDLQAAGAADHSISGLPEHEQLAGTGGDTNSDAVVGDDSTDAVIDNNGDEQPISRTTPGTSAARPRTQAAGLLTSKRKSLGRDLKLGKLKFKEGSERYDKQFKEAHPDLELIHVGAGRWRKVADIIDTTSASEPPQHDHAATQALGTVASPVQEVSESNAEPHLGHVNDTASPSTSRHALPVPADAEDRSTRKYRSRKPRTEIDIEISDLPVDVDGDFEPDDEPRPVKKARLADGQPAPKRRAGGRPRIRGFPDAEDLLMSVALIRVLCGGLYQTSIKWELVAHAMSFRYEPDYLSARWNPVRVGNQGRVEHLQEAIREPFLAAYEKGELPSINFQHPEKTDWPAVLEWVKQIDPQSSVPHVKEIQVAENQVVELPESANDLEDGFTISAHGTATEADLEQHFRAASGEQRGVLALRYIEGVPLTNQIQAESQTSGSLEVLKSWCRAVSVAKPENYDGKAASQKISTAFSGTMIKRAVDELQADSTLTLEKGGHQVPGRNYRMHNATLKQFRRWPDEEFQYLRDVAAARARIIAHFAAHDTLELTMHSKDPEIVVLTNMVSQGLVRVTSTLPEQNNDIDAPMPRLSIWGIDGIQTIYDSKNVDPARLRFPIIYRGTPKFTHEHGLQQVAVPLVRALHDGQQDPRIPLWVDIHGNLVDEVWDMVMRSVLWLLVFRPGSTAAAIQKAHDDKLWEFEIHMLLGWMEQTGLAQRFGAGQEVEGTWKGGWRASEWWYCACAEDIATWEAPVCELR